MKMKMKKTLSLLIALLLIVSSFGLIVNAEILDKDDISNDGDSVVVLWDNVQMNGAVLGQDGAPLDYLTDHFDVVSGPADSFGVAGWVGCSQDIVAFGYCVDGGEPVLSADYKYETQEDVINAAKTMGCDFASRYKIIIDATGIEGNHVYNFLCQLEDGRIFKMSIHDGTEVAFTFSPDGSAVVSTPTPDPEKEAAPMIMLRFDDDDKYIEGGFFGNLRNSIDDIEFNEEKKCYVIKLENASDPWVMMQFSLLSMDDDTYLIDTDKYKIMQLGLRVSKAEEATLGQIYYETEDDPTLGESKAVSFRMQQTDEKQYVNVNLGRNKNWKGYMLEARLDPLGSCNGAVDYEVYYLAFFSDEDAASEFGESWLEKGDEIMPTAAPTPEPTEKPTNAPTPEMTPIPTDAPKTIAPATEEVAPTEQSQQGPSGENKGANVGLIIGIIAGVLAAAGIVAALVISKKKKK